MSSGWATPGPGRAWYVAGAVAMAEGPLGLLWLAMAERGLAGAVERRFIAPGEITVRFGASGVQALWRERSGAAEPGLPDDLTITLIDLTRGVETPVEPAPGRLVRVGGAEREEVARFTVVSPGPHRVEVTGSFPEVTMLIGAPGAAAPAGAPEWLTIATDTGGAWRAGARLAFGALTAAGVAGGSATILVTFGLRRRARREAGRTERAAQLQD
jgi:hypothetical protein